MGRGIRVRSQEGICKFYGLRFTVAVLVLTASQGACVVGLIKVLGLELEI